MSLVVTLPLHRHRGRSVRFDATQAAPREVSRRPARVAQLLALAHHVRAAIEDGRFADQAGVARALGLTRARLTQVMDLLLLAPDLQDRVLGLEALDGVEPLPERALRPVVRHTAWSAQRAAFARLVLWGPR